MAKQPKYARFVTPASTSARGNSGRWILQNLVQQISQETGIDTSRLKLELTESLVLHNVEDTITKMKTLNALGIQFSMDDFGTGYSSLSQLNRLPIAQLKIDRSFVSQITQNRNDAVIVQNHHWHGQ